MDMFGLYQLSTQTESESRNLHWGKNPTLSKMEDQPYVAYKDMLISIADIVDQESFVLERMKFKCDSFIKGRERDQIKSAIQLWTALEKREYLGLSNTKFLKDLLKSCMKGHAEVLNVLEKYERLIGVIPTFSNQQLSTTVVNLERNPQIIYVQQSSHTDPTRQCPQQNVQAIGPDLTTEFAFLTNSLGKHWSFLIRELGVPESEIEMIMSDYKYTKEQIHQCLITWKGLHKKEATKQRLINALREIDRHDLADTLEEGIY